MARTDAVEHPNIWAYASACAAAATPDRRVAIVAEDLLKALEESIHRARAARRRQPCKRCDGDGYVEVFDDEVMQIVATYGCTACGGTGVVGDVD